MKREQTPDLNITDTFIPEDYPMGNHVHAGITTFKVFSPMAKGIEVVCFRDFQGIESHSLQLKKKRIRHLVRNYSSGSD